MFTPRIEIPDKNNRYYIPTSSGGLNPGIAKPAGSPFQFQNCVFYSLGRFAEVTGVWLKSTNAENFVEVAKGMGLTVSDKPVLGAIAVWGKGVIGNGNDGAGHVANVEIINSTGTIVTSESGWGASKPFWTQTRKNDGNWGQNSSYKFLGFIHPPSSISPTHPVLKEGCKGDSVIDLQTKLANLGYYYKGSIDGDFGLKTLGAVLAFQFKMGLEVDGTCGPKTWTKLDAICSK
jgi:surface antigen